MPNSFFAFKQFTIRQDQCAMKVTTDACIFGAWASREAKTINKNNLQVLDIGAGTGLLSLFFAQQFKDAVIEGVELDKAAAQQAKQNVDDCQFGNNITITQADVTSYQPKKLFDIIVSNPPFFEKDLAAKSLQRNWAFHDQGLKLNELLLRIHQWLAPDGLFFLLLPPKREAELLKYCQDYKLTMLTSCAVQANATKDAHCIFYKGQKEKVTNNPALQLQPPLLIQGEQQGYAPRVANLLADYYLHL
jgi:tRNA1Val (adenine37-N6)-methyltransferase